MNDTEARKLATRAANMADAISWRGRLQKMALSAEQHRVLDLMVREDQPWADFDSKTVRALVSRGVISPPGVHNAALFLGLVAYYGGVERPRWIDGCARVTELGLKRHARRHRTPSRSDDKSAERSRGNMEIIGEIRDRIAKRDSWCKEHGEPISEHEDKLYAIRLIVEAERIGAAGQVLRRIRMAARCLAGMGPPDSAGTWLSWSDAEHKRDCLLMEWAP